MRMWMIDPKLMCNQHLLGEHVELHMFVGTIRMGKKLGGYVRNKLVEVQNIKTRHEELVREMVARGMKHKSQLHFEWEGSNVGEVNIESNEVEIGQRCAECFRRIHAVKGI